MDRFESQRRSLGGQIEKYSCITSDQSKSVGITLRYPVFSDFTPDQLSYYLYWRGTVGKPSFRKAPEGYTWLLICEIINGNDRAEASRLINAICTSQAKDGSPLYPELLDTAIEYSLVFGTPMPRYEAWMGESCDLTPWILSGTVSDPASHMLHEYVTGIQVRDGICRTYGNILRKYSSLLASEGTSFEKTFLKRTKSAVIPFKDFVLLGNKTPVEIIAWKQDRKRLEGLFQYIEGQLTGCPATPVDIPCQEGLSQIIEEVKVSEEYDPSPDPFSKTSAVICRKLGSQCTDMGPSYLSDSTATDHTSSVMRLGDILTFSKKEALLPAEFVTSDIIHPTYDDLSRDRFAYFVYWRSCFDRGRYLDTDEGYVNLFLDELINTDDTDGTDQKLRRLLEVYGNTGLIAATLVDHTLLGGKPFTDHRIYLDKLTVNSWIESFVEGTNTTPLDDELLDMMRSGNPKVKFLGDKLPVKPFADALRHIFRTMAAKKPLQEIVSVERLTVKRSIYVGLDYFRGPKECKVTFTNYLGCRKFTTFVDKAAKYASTVLKDLSSGTVRKHPPFSFGGVNCASVICEEFEIWYATANAPRPVEIRLDMAAIESAESDLRDVTEMMKVEEIPEEEHVEEIQRTDTDPGDPWELLSASLDDNEKEYLKLCAAESDASAFLRGLKVPRIKIEDSVNTKALDTVGDTIVEDGTIVEDYVEELKKGLKW